MSGLSPSLLQKGQNYTLFTAFWLTVTGTSLPRSPLSVPAGIILFIILDLCFSLLAYLKKIRNQGIAAQLVMIAGILLLFPLTGLAGFLTAKIPFPHDLFLLKIRSYLVYLLPALVLARLLELSVRRVVVPFTVNLLTLSVILSRGGWSLNLPAGSLEAAYLLIFLFLVFQTLLLLTGGRSGYRLSFYTLLIALLVPLVALLPLSRLQRNESRKEGGGLLESSLFRFDFSDYLSLESSISMKDDLVFLMKTDGAVQNTMTRRFVLSAYSPERGFFRDEAGSPESPGTGQNDYVLPESPRTWEYPEFELTSDSLQEYFLVNFDSSAFLGFNAPVSVTPFESWDDSSFSRIYRVESRVSSAWGWDLVDSDELIPDLPENSTFLEYYTRGGAREDLVQLAGEITAESRTYYDRVTDIEEYLKNNYYYSLTPGESADGDQLSHFLYESQKGYCSYFAFSMALLCRSAGIPARVALGFWVDESSKVLDYYPVRANQAHAWVEVFFPEYGWVDFDPTSSTMAPGEEFSISPVSAKEMEPYLKEILENRDGLTVQSAGVDMESSGGERQGGLPVLTTSLRMTSALLLLLLTFLLFRIRSVLYRIPRRGRSIRRFFHLHMHLSSVLFRPPGQMESPGEYSNAMGETLPGFSCFAGLYERILFGRGAENDMTRLKTEGQALRQYIFRQAAFRQRITYTLILIRGLLAPVKHPEGSRQGKRRMR